MKKIGALLVILMFISSMVVVADDAEIVEKECGLFCTAGKWLFGDAGARALAGTAWFDRNDLPLATGMGGAVKVSSVPSADKDYEGYTFHNHLGNAYFIGLTGNVHPVVESGNVYAPGAAIPNIKFTDNDFIPASKYGWTSLNPADLTVSNNPKKYLAVTNKGIVGPIQKRKSTQKIGNVYYFCNDKSCHKRENGEWADSGKTKDVLKAEVTLGTSTDQQVFKKNFVKNGGEIDKDSEVIKGDDGIYYLVSGGGYIRDVDGNVQTGKVVSGDGKSVINKPTFSNVPAGTMTQALGATGANNFKRVCDGGGCHWERWDGSTWKNAPDYTTGYTGHQLVDQTALKEVSANDFCSSESNNCRVEQSGDQWFIVYTNTNKIDQVTSVKTDGIITFTQLSSIKDVKGGELIANGGVFFSGSSPIKYDSTFCTKKGECVYGADDNNIYRKQTSGANDGKWCSSAECIDKKPTGIDPADPNNHKYNPGGPTNVPSGNLDGPSSPPKPSSTTYSYAMDGGNIKISKNGEATGTTYNPVEGATLTDGKNKLPVYEWHKDKDAKGEHYVAVGTEFLRVKKIDDKWEFVDKDDKKTDKDGAVRSTVINNNKGGAKLTTKDGLVVAPVAPTPAAAAAAKAPVIAPKIKAVQKANQEALQSQVASLLGHDLYQKYEKQITNGGGIKLADAPDQLTTGVNKNKVDWKKTKSGLYEATVDDNKVTGRLDPKTGEIVTAADASGTETKYQANYEANPLEPHLVSLGGGSGMLIKPLETGQVKNTVTIMKTEGDEQVLDEKNSGDFLLSGESKKGVTNNEGEGVFVDTRAVVVFQSTEEKGKKTLTIGGETFAVGTDNVVDDLKKGDTIKLTERVPTEVKVDDGKSSITTYKNDRVIGYMEYDEVSDQRTVRRFDTKVETTENHKTREKMVFDLDGTKYDGDSLERNEGILYDANGDPSHLLGTNKDDDVTLMDIKTGLYAGVITETDTYGTVKMVQTDYNEMEYYTENGESVGRFTLDNNGNWRNKEGINPETALSRKTNPPTLTLENKKALAIANNIEIVNQNMKEAQTKKATSDAGIFPNRIEGYDPAIASQRETISSSLLKVKEKINPELAELKHIVEYPNQYSDERLEELFPNSGFTAEGLRGWIRDTGIPTLEEEIVKAIADQKTAEATIKELLKEKSALETQKAAIEAGEYPGLPEDWSSIDNPDTQSALISAAATTEGVNSGKYLESNGLLKSVGKFKNKDDAEVEVFTSYDGNLYTSDGTFIGDDDVLVSSAGTSSGLATAKEAAKKATAEHLGEIEEDIKAAKDEVKKAGPLSDSEEISGKSTEIKQNSFTRGAQIGVNSIYAITGQLSKSYSSLNQLWQDEQWYKDWTGVFDETFAPALGAQWFPSAICEGHYDIEPEGTAMIKTVSGTYQAVAHIEAEVTPDLSPVLCSRNPDVESDEEWICGKEQVCVEDNFCYADTDGDKEPDNDDIVEGHFYKITWAVSAPRDETFTPYVDENGVAVSFNVILYYHREKTNERSLPLYKRGGDDVGPVELNNGERDSDVFTQFSANVYDEVCIVWENAPSSVGMKKSNNPGTSTLTALGGAGYGVVGGAGWSGVTGVNDIDDVCFGIVKSSAGIVTWQKSSKASSSHKVSNNDPEIEATEI